MKIKKCYKDINHTFAICAYKDSPYLEKCIASIEAQTVKTNIIMVTSTPSEYIENMAKKHNIKLFINKGVAGIAGDWNFAYNSASTDLVTIAHQDDIYEAEYAYNIITEANKADKPIILFSDYGELRGKRKVYKNKLLNIKKLMLIPLRIRAFHKSKFIRRRILSFGSPICCPSVTYVKDNLVKFGDKLFLPDYFGAVDWQAWERFSKEKGSFVYIRKYLMLHRIHQDSETSRIIEDNHRSKEDLEMYKKFWPLPIARLLEHFYNKGEDSNSL